MGTSAWITFILVAGLIWGGFVFFIFLAFRNESQKESEAPPAETAPADR